MTKNKGNVSEAIVWIKRSDDEPKPCAAASKQTQSTGWAEVPLHGHPVSPLLEQALF
jgi:hypothetical protein